MDNKTKYHPDPKRSSKRNPLINYRPMTCNEVEYTNGKNQGGSLLFVNKLQTVPWRTERNKGLSGTGDIQYIDQYILKESKTKQKNVDMVWIDDKMSYDIVPQSWIIDFSKMWKVFDVIIKFIEQKMENWGVELTAGEKRLLVVKIQCGIFQGDMLSPLLFVIRMMSLNSIIRKCTCRYKLTKSQEKINHLMTSNCLAKMKKNWKP